MAVALDGTLGTVRLARVDVETGGRLARGLTAAADERRSDRPPNTHIVDSIDQPKFLERLERCFAGKKPGT
jgi:inosine-uridine nucleoside N-ribohydrolase